MLSTLNRITTDYFDLINLSPITTMGLGLIEVCVIFSVTRILFILLEFLCHFHHLAMWEVYKIDVSLYGSFIYYYY